MKHFTILAAIFIGLALPVHAQQDAAIDQLIEALSINEDVSIMREEGISSGIAIAEDMFPGRGVETWPKTVANIYGADWMNETIKANLTRELEGVDIESLNTFFIDGIGKQFIALEISARRAIMDEAVEEAANEQFKALHAKNDPLVSAVKRYISANDLVEFNVVGALNSNFAFYLGLDDGNAFEGDMTEDEILRDVWGQEEQIREDTEKWLNSFLTIAYKPVSAADMDAYIAQSRTPEGIALNRALFYAFDDMFDVISRRLGRAAARMMVGEDL